ncbi:CZB domain-containing protein [Persephonella atlantica]
MKNLADVVSGKISWIPPDYTECALGKWYYSTGEDEIKKISESSYEMFKGIEQPHREFHLTGNSFIENFKNKKIESAINDGMKLINQSAEVVLSIQKLAENIRVCKVKI